MNVTELGKIMSLSEKYLKEPLFSLQDEFFFKIQLNGQELSCKCDTRVEGQSEEQKLLRLKCALCSIQVQSFFQKIPRLRTADNHVTVQFVSSICI